MDQDAYRKIYRDMNERDCLFEKSVLANQCNCSQASRFYLAEREGVHCRSDDGQRRCEELLQLLRQHSRFALKSANQTGALPHAKAMRIQVGGLRGLYIALNPGKEAPTKVDDIFALVKSAADKFTSLERLPFQILIKHVAAYKGRIRRSRG